MASRPVVQEPAPSPVLTPFSEDLLPPSIYGPKWSDTRLYADQEHLEDGDPGARGPQAGPQQQGRPGPGASDPPGGEVPHLCPHVP